MTYFEADSRLQLTALPAWQVVLKDLTVLRESAEIRMETCQPADLPLLIGEWRALKSVIASLRSIPEEARKVIDAHTQAVDKTVGEH